jgi:hypothetical protein
MWLAQRIRSKAARESNPQLRTRMLKLAADMDEIAEATNHLFCGGDVS